MRARTPPNSAAAAPTESNDTAGFRSAVLCSTHCCCHEGLARGQCFELCQAQSFVGTHGDHDIGSSEHRGHVGGRTCQTHLVANLMPINFPFKFRKGFGGIHVSGSGARQRAPTVRGV